MKKIFIIIIVLLFAGFAFAGECVKPEKVKIYVTEYKGVTYYRIGNLHFVYCPLEQAQREAAEIDKQNESNYQRCVERDEWLKAQHRAENALNNGKWIEVR